jgi:hypothetical protein
MMTLGKYIDRVDMRILERLDKCRRIEVHSYVRNEGRGMEIQVDLPEPQALGVDGYAWHRYIRRGNLRLSFYDRRN